MLRLCVSDDRALRAWILSFGASPRVLAPANLVTAISGEILAANARYLSRARFEMLRVMPSMSGRMPKYADSAYPLSARRDRMTK